MFPKSDESLRFHFLFLKPRSPCPLDPPFDYQPFGPVVLLLRDANFFFAVGIKIPFSPNEHCFAEQ